MIRLTVDAADDAVKAPLGTADEWRVLLTHAGQPISQFALPDPGAASDALTERLILRHARATAIYAELREDLVRRLGAPAPHRADISISVVVCTHRRPSYVQAALAAIAGLDPAPDEVVVVDNDPGDANVRTEVEDAGFRYVREDARGLDNARTTGLLAATGDVVAFTDDDCLPARTWLRSVAELFADPLVAAVTGPAFAHSFEHPAQRRFEDSGGFGRGFRRRVFEWTWFPPARASQAGAGANMIVRRAAAEQVGGLFPPELDAGTSTQSGGDLFALYALIAGGWRVVYDPGTFVFHQHRPSWEAMHSAFRGYGVGMSAALAKLLLERRDLGTFGAWRWLVRQYARALARRAGGRDDAVDVRIAWDYLQGGILGVPALIAARRALAPRTAVIAPSTKAGPEQPFSRPTARSLSVIVTTADRPHALARCLAALARQTANRFETIVVDDRGSAELPPLAPAGTTLIRAAGRGAAGARNLGARRATGDILLFLDDDLVADDGLVARHAEAHADGKRTVLVGHSRPCPSRENLVSRGATRWWADDFTRRCGAAVPTFVDMLSGNMSIGRGEFLALGGFDERFGPLRREDWELGVRVLAAGVALRYDSHACADHEFTLTTDAALRVAYNEGRGDALLAALHPVTVPTLRRVARRRRVFLVPFVAASAAPLLGLALDALEGLRARRAWWRLFGLARDLSYAAGRSRSELPHAPPASPTTLEVNSEAPVEVPAVAAPRVVLEDRRRPVATISAPGGRWGRELAEELAARVPWEVAVSRATPDGPQAYGSTSVDDLSVFAWTGPAAGERDVRSAKTALVALVVGSLPPDPGWPADALALFDGPRIDAVSGGGLEPWEPPPPAFLRWRGSEPVPYRVFGPPVRYLIVRRERFEAVGGFGPRVAGLGPYAATAELTERLVDSGGLVARLDLNAFVAPRSAGARAESRLARSHDRGRLVWRRALEDGPGRGVIAIARFEVGPLALLLARRDWRRSAGALADLAGLLSAAPRAALSSEVSTRRGARSPRGRSSGGS